MKDFNKVEHINYRKHAAIKEYIEKISKNKSEISKIYGGVVKINNFKETDDKGNLIGEISELEKFKELSIK